MHPAEIALFAGKPWQPGRRPGVRFLDGTAAQEERVAHHATTWSTHANVTLDSSAGARAEIRVSFTADPGSWSAVGTDCLVTAYLRKGEPTMNLGWLRDDTDDEECRRVVLQEFGHALGAIHEHPTPRGGIQWNRPAVYAYFGGPPSNWTEEETAFNVVMKYSLDQLNATRFDRRSIMLHALPPALVEGGTALPLNTRLSRGDRRFIKKMYPGR